MSFSRVMSATSSAVYTPACLQKQKQINTLIRKEPCYSYARNQHTFRESLHVKLQRFVYFFYSRVDQHCPIMWCKKRRITSAFWLSIFLCEHTTNPKPAEDKSVVWTGTLLMNVWVSSNNTLINVTMCSYYGCHWFTHKTCPTLSDLCLTQTVALTEA